MVIVGGDIYLVLGQCDNCACMDQYVFRRLPGVAGMTDLVKQPPPQTPAKV